METVFKVLLKNLLLLLLATQIESSVISSGQSSTPDLMKCSYGERGSLTATCVNATASFFKTSPYRFDHLDETLVCVNCSLDTLDSNTFDIAGNQIKNLDLSHSLIGTVRQKAFAGLIFLEKLTLAHNAIRSILPGTFLSVKKISDINLYNNSISILNDDGFLELMNLKNLNLKRNVIEAVQNKAFNGLESLEVLDLSYNKISSIQGIFDNLTALKVLDLTNNKIFKLNGKDFSNLTSLLELRLSHNSIVNIPAGEFIDIENLRTLDLSYNLIQEIIAGSFQGLTSLEVLNISHNGIMEIPQKALQNLHGLHVLDVSQNKIDTFQTGIYSGLPQLRILNVSDNFIQQIEITGVFSLHSLHALDLSSNNITDVDYVELVRRLPRISYLSLKNNLLSCDLDDEMQDYFSQDNFKFDIFRDDAPKCIDKPRNAKIKIAVNDELGSESSSVWMIVLICVTLLLVAVLYYVQFKIYKEIRSNSFLSRRATSAVQLISSDLESRDNDFLKE